MSGGSVSTTRGLPLKGANHHHLGGGVGGGVVGGGANMTIYSNQADLELDALDGMVGNNGHFLGSPVHGLDDSLSLHMDPYGQQVRVSTGNYAQYTLQRTAINPLTTSNGSQHLQVRKIEKKPGTSGFDSRHIGVTLTPSCYVH